MIMVLDGNFEKVDYNDNSSILLHINNEYENYPPHWHTATEIIMPLQNSYTVVGARETFHLREYDILIMPAGELHELLAPTTGTRLILQFDPFLLHSVQCFSGTMAFLDYLRLITPEKSPLMYDRLRTLMLDVRDEYLSQKALNGAAIYAKIIEMYVILGRNTMNAEALFPDVNSRKQKEYVGKLNIVFEYINNHYAEDLDLDTISSIAGFSKYHFSRLFKQFTNQSFYEYLNQKRVKKAEALLLNPKLSITDVAMQTGFLSISTFNRIFKSIKDCTPSEFKTMYRSKQVLAATHEPSLVPDDRVI